MLLLENLFLSLLKEGNTMKQQIIINSKSEEEILLLKRILERERIDISLKGLKSKEDSSGNKERKALVVPDNYYFKPSPYWQPCEKKRNNSTLSPPNCPNCGSRLWHVSDMMNGYFIIMTRHYLGLLKTMIQAKKAPSMICRSCKLEFS
jgi:hypothetical protein